jgi:hypothetical protein
MDVASAPLGPLGIAKPMILGDRETGIGIGIDYLNAFTDLACRSSNLAQQEGHS